MRNALYRQAFAWLIVLVSAEMAPFTEAGVTTDREPRPITSHSRRFTFTYAAAIDGLTPGQPVRVWLPVPSTDETQQVELVNADVPAGASVATEPRFGNRVMSFALPAQHRTTAVFSLIYRVIRHEITTPLRTCPVPAGATMSDPAALLRPDARVPVGGEPASLLAGKTLPGDPRLDARFLYDVVDDHLQYRKDKPGWGTGDAMWACHSGFGNCTDFHSLFISLARTEKIPSVFQIGFPIGDASAGDVKGYHCWAWTKIESGWIPVDISEANLHPSKRDYYFGHLDPNRIAFSIGRDLELVPKQAGPPLNYFVYPYVEEGGKTVPPERIAKAFRYAP